MSIGDFFNGVGDFGKELFTGIENTANSLSGVATSALGTYGELGAAYNAAKNGWSGPNKTTSSPAQPQPQQTIDQSGGNEKMILYAGIGVVALAAILVMRR